MTWRLFGGVLCFVWMFVLIVWELRAASRPNPLAAHVVRTVLIATNAALGLVLTGLVQP